MPEKFLAIDNFVISKDNKQFAIEKGKDYTKKELVEFLGSESSLKFKLKCTSLKRAIIEFDKDVAESIKDELSEATTAEATTAEATTAEATTAEATTAEATTAEATTAEATTFVNEMFFLVNKQIKKDNKVLFKKSDKVKIADLEGFDISKLVEDGFLTEIKITNETENKD